MNARATGARHKWSGLARDDIGACKDDISACEDEIGAWESIIRDNWSGCIEEMV